MDIITKICSACGKEKPMDQFPAGRKGRHCKNCLAERARKYYATHKEEYRGYLKKYTAANKNEIVLRHKRYRDTHKDDIKQKKHNFYAVNKDKINAHKQEYNIKNKEKISMHRRQHYIENQEEIYKKIYKYRKEHPEVAMNSKRRRRALKLQAGGNFTEVEFKALCDKYGNICLCCKQAKKLVADHIIPLSKGGANNINNIQPLCHNCNARKSTKTIDYR